MRKLVVVLGAVAVVAAACGKPSAKVYSEVRSRACFREHGIRVGPPPATDFIASTALGGSFRARLRPNFVTVSFGDTVGDAENLDQAYRRVHARNVGIDDVLRLQGNAVMLWQQHPTDDELSLVQGCLKT
ncbi:MAG TPA: hypothetical protein VFA19_00555 [Gaiellaceae bacterium]|nr:hypothetical protein [Gaiellaceae bacterium]